VTPARTLRTTVSLLVVNPWIDSSVRVALSLPNQPPITTRCPCSTSSMPRLARIARAAFNLASMIFEPVLQQATSQDVGGRPPEPQPGSVVSPHSPFTQPESPGRAVEDLAQAMAGSERAADSSRIPWPWKKARSGGRAAGGDSPTRHSQWQCDRRVIADSRPRSARSNVNSSRKFVFAQRTSGIQSEPRGCGCGAIKKSVKRQVT
jgi:hypothetical protein